jgi:hypothetical protein
MAALLAHKYLARKFWFELQFNIPFPRLVAGVNAHWVVVTMIA